MTPFRSRVAMCRRERYLHKLGSRWLEAEKRSDRDRERERVAIASVVAPVAYGESAQYGGGGRPELNQDLQQVLDDTLDRLQSSEVRPVDLADALETLLATPEQKRRLPSALKPRSIDLLGWYFDVEPQPRNLRPRQRPVRGLPDRSIRRFTSRTHYVGGNMVGTQENGAHRVIPLRTIYQGTTTLTVFAS